MRETKLFEYATSARVADFASVDVAVSSRDTGASRDPQGTWAGLLDGRMAWRVEEGSVLVFESIVEKTGIRLNLSSLITCKPLLRTVSSADATLVEILLSCFSGRNGCTIVQLQVRLPKHGSSHGLTAEEVSRQVMPGTWATSMTEVDGDVIVGRADGSCALMRFFCTPSRKMTIVPFAAHPVQLNSNRNQGENTSMVSGASDESGDSRRSIASSVSLGLMNRLFGSPRGTTSPSRHHVQTTSRDTGSILGLSGRRGDRAAYKKTMDKVVGVAKVVLEGKGLMSLHESGRICVYVWKDSMYQYATDVALPIKLSSSVRGHFLLTGPPESTIAVIMADEDPQPDSLRLFSITAKFRSDRAATLSLTQIAERDGPIDRIVSASFTGENVLVATESGLLSGVLNVPNDSGQRSGIPTGTLWTALDDVDQEYGLGHVLDEIAPSPKDQLLQANRFSCSAVAKALRLDNPESTTRPLIAAAVRETIFEDDEIGTWKRVKTRSEQITKTEDLTVRDLSVSEGVGVVVARQKALYVLRVLSESEKTLLGNQPHLLQQNQATTISESAIMLSSHAALQILAARYVNEGNEGDVKKRLRFMLQLASSFSALTPGLPVTDVLAAKEAVRMTGERGEGIDFLSAMTSTLSTLEPGAQLLLFLHSAGETELLHSAAEQSADLLPISAMFALGVSWLARYRVRASQKTLEEETETADEVMAENEDQSGKNAAERAYGCLLTAVDWCTNADIVTDSDIECALALSGLSKAIPQPLFEARGNDAMAVDRGLSENVLEAVSPMKNPGFWLLERSVRLLANSGSASNSATAALKAMSLAPDRERHEMMRAAAFSGFLDGGSLDNALATILTKPFQGGDRLDVVLEESRALRDAIDLFVNATADKGMLQWLADRKLPEPLYAFCNTALERRARAADALNTKSFMTTERVSRNALGVPARTDYEDMERPISEYEQLYSWYILRGDDSSAATAALEWGERLCTEGLSTIRGLIACHSENLPPDAQVRMLLSWAKCKCIAWSFATSAVQMQSTERRYALRSRFSMAADDSGASGQGVVGLGWISRRHLLAHAQCRCFTEMLSRIDQGKTGNQAIQYLVGYESTPLLAEQREGVRWAVSTLLDYPTYDNLLLCAELGSAWREEIGVFALEEVVRNAAKLASRKTITTFGYADLDKLLHAVVSAEGKTSMARNWNLLALESALSTSAGTFTCPQWLVHAAAWGTDAFVEGFSSLERKFAGRSRGDAGGAVRALLRNHRPVDAARLLLEGIKRQATATTAGSRAFYVPYSAIDAAMEMLEHFVDDYEEAEVYRDLLAKHTTAHITQMKRLASDKMQESRSALAQAS